MQVKRARLGLALLAVSVISIRLLASAAPRPEAHTATSSNRLFPRSTFRICKCATRD